MTRRDTIIDKIMGRCEVQNQSEALDFAALFAKNAPTFLVGLDLVIKSPIRNNFSTLGMQAEAETKLLLQLQPHPQQSRVNRYEYLQDLAA